jgi:hypothetical protein
MKNMNNSYDTKKIVVIFIKKYFYILLIWSIYACY